MARLAVTSAVLLLLFAFSYARTTSDLPESDVIDHHASESQPDSHTYPSLLLPSEKTETADQATVAESIPESDPEPTEHHVSLDALDLHQPPDLVSFRPINRHFGADREFSLRLPRRPCRHGHKGHREIPYGNDMILSGENRDFDPMGFNGGGLRRMPPRWVRLHHRHHHHRHHDHEDGRPGFPFQDHMFKRHFRHERKERDDEREEDEGGFNFMKRFRKFMHHF